MLPTAGKGVVLKYASLSRVKCKTKENVTRGCRPAGTLCIFTLCNMAILVVMSF